jgi:ankyrin repeat protein
MTEDGVPLPENIRVLTEALFEFAREGRMDLLDHIRSGVPANLLDVNGNSFLMLAAYHSHTELVAGLLELGANPNLANDHGQTPLAGAVFKHHRAIVDQLLAAEADPDMGSPSARQAAEMFGFKL